MEKINFNELTLDNFANWPQIIKISLIVIACLIVFTLGFWFDTRSELKKLTVAEQKENELRQDFQVKAAEAANLPSYQQQLAQIQQTLASMVQQLPNSTEIPNLLEDISKIGLNNGLQFQLFKPLPEQDQGFFIELPIQISVIGNYHQLGLFISQIAGLNRIVTLQDFVVDDYKPNNDTKADASVEPGDDRLVMNVTAKTYRYPEASTTNNTTETSTTSNAKSKAKDSKK